MKIKVNFKLLIALGIVLLALFTFNISTVSAAATANSLDKVPDIIEVGIATTDAIQDGYMSDKLSDILYTKVIESIADKDISAKQVTVSFVHEKLLDMAEVKVCLYDSSLQTTLIAEKTVTLKYTDSWNKSDRDYIENKCSNIKEFNLNNLEVDFDDKDDCKKVIENGFDTLINDSTIKCTFYAQQGQWVYPGLHIQGVLAFSKNGVTYFTVSTGLIIGNPIMTVPVNIEDTEEAYIKYALSRLKTLSQYSDTELRMEKEEGENEYLLYEGDSKEPYLILLKKDTRRNEIISTDKETNIKLETTSAVVPSNTTLEVESIKEGTTFENVKKVVSNVKSFIAFDITLKSDEEKIQPQGNVKISIPIPSDMGTSNLIVYRISDAGEKIEYKVTVETINNVKYATFETNHFSTYVLAEKELNNNQITDEKDETPKTGTINYIYLALPITVIATIGIVILKKKEIK